MIRRLIEPLGCAVSDARHRRDKGGDGRFHVGGAAAIEHAVRDLGGEGIGVPAFAHRHHIGMAGKAEMRRGIAEPGIKIVHIAERQAMGGKAQLLQHRFQHVQRAGILRRHRRAADQGLGQGERRR